MRFFLQFPPTYRAKIFWVVLFGVSMGYFEASVVVYLRELYYPGGFTFPLKAAPIRMLAVELVREFWSIVMLVSVAALSGRRFWERFGYFIIIFGVWDIFYYVWLKVAIGWPESLLDRDLLFLIPLPWIGPVIAPCLVALLMIVIGVSITRLFHEGHDFKPTRSTWILAVLATLLILYSFMRDTGAGLRQAEPEPYPYPLLVLGLILYSGAYMISVRKTLGAGSAGKNGNRT